MRIICLFLVIIPFSLTLYAQNKLDKKLIEKEIAWIMVGIGDDFDYSIQQPDDYQYIDLNNDGVVEVIVINRCISGNHWQQSYVFSLSPIKLISTIATSGGYLNKKNTRTKGYYDLSDGVGTWKWNGHEYQ
jgi:hypothetical protein